jgi:hypothetical protein
MAMQMSPTIMRQKVANHHAPMGFVAPPLAAEKRFDVPLLKVR